MSTDRSKPRAFQGVYRKVKTTEKGLRGGSFASATAADGTKRTIEVAMVATDGHLDHLARINVGNKASGEGSYDQPKATS